MEPAKIDWKRVESVYIEDKLYENINAPKWFDFLTPEDVTLVNDEAWFCKSDCKHPKTIEDFYRSTPISKIPRSLSSAQRLLLGDQSKSRDAKLKKRRFLSNENPRFELDSENQNANAVTPNQQFKSLKEMIKSSSEKITPTNSDEDNITNNVEPHRGLKSTLSARNLFAGKDIMSHLSEFCNELKKLTMRAKDRENHVEKPDEIKPETVKHEKGSSQMDAVVEERKPFAPLSLEKPKGSSVKEKQKRIKRFDDAENVPISLNMENVKQKGEDRLLLQQIRTNPPSPQCFSAQRPPFKTTTPLKTPTKSRLMERGILQELTQNDEAAKEVPIEKSKSSISIIDGRAGEARGAGGGGLDVFWFLKPCTTTSTLSGV
ncbi:hypothetical protein ACFE04_002041 [Oxalis oulophora]